MSQLQENGNEAFGQQTHRGQHLPMRKLAYAAAIAGASIALIDGCDPFNINLSGILPHSDASGAVNAAVLDKVNLDSKLEIIDGEGEASGTFFKYTSSWIPLVGSLSERHVNITRHADVQVMLDEGHKQVRLRPLNYSERNPATTKTVTKVGVLAVVNVDGLYTQSASARYGHDKDGKIQANGGEAVGARLSDFFTGGGSSVALTAAGTEAADNTFQRLCGAALMPNIEIAAAQALKNQLLITAGLWSKDPSRKTDSNSLSQIANDKIDVVFDFKGRPINPAALLKFDPAFLPKPTTDASFGRDLGVAKKDVRISTPNTCYSSPTAVTQETRLMIETAEAKPNTVAYPAPVKGGGNYA